MKVPLILILGIIFGFAQTAPTSDDCPNVKADASTLQKWEESGVRKFFKILIFEITVCRNKISESARGSFERVKSSTFIPK